MQRPESKAMLRRLEQLSRADLQEILKDAETLGLDLLLQAGLRYDLWNSSDQPLFNQNFENRYGFSPGASGVSAVSLPDLYCFCASPVTDARMLSPSFIP